MSDVIDKLNQQAELKIDFPEPPPKPRPARRQPHAIPQVEPPVDSTERDALRQEVERLKTELALREESMSQTETLATADEYPTLQREIEKLLRAVADREADIAELRVNARLAAETPPAPPPRPDQQVEIVRLTRILEESGAITRDLETQVARARKTENGQKELIEDLQQQLAEAQHDRDQHSATAARATETITRLEQNLQSSETHMQQREQQWDQVLREQEARERRLQNQKESASQELVAARQQLPEVKVGMQRETVLLRTRLQEEEQRTADLTALSERIQARQTIVIAGAIVAALLAASLGFVFGQNWSSGPAPAIQTPPPKMIATPQPLPATPAAVQSAWPVISVKGVQTRATPDTLTLLFDDGVFSSGTKIDSGAQARLRVLSQPLATARPAVRIEVQGCTDAQGDPDRNRALAQKRADIVREFIVRETGLPATAVSATPAASPPYPGTSPDADRKNRTVVLVVRRG